MKEIKYDGNLYELPKATKREACIVTTNGMVKRDGKAVMGAGIAKYCRDTFSGVDKVLGDYLKANGNHVHCLGWQTISKVAGLFLLFSFPTKDHWKDPSKPELIRRSCRELKEMADRFEVDTIYMNCPGCGCGKLDYAKEVRHILSEELDDRFVVCIPSNIYGGVKNEL